jgi:hypothetical protein
MAELVDKRDGDLVFTQLPLSLSTQERGTPATMSRPVAHLHLHLAIPLVDAVTGEVDPLARMPRDAWEASRAVAPWYGWEPPNVDNRERRREPRGAHSLGVWHGESVAPRLAWEPSPEHAFLCASTRQNR